MASRALLTGLLCAFAAFTAGCQPADTSPPAPPIVDPIESPTATSPLRVSGSAEFGSTVRIAGGGAAVETTADPYTARWFAEVELDLGDNPLSVTATDAAGNQSDPTAATVIYVEPGNPATVTIDGPATTRAGVPVTFEVHVYDDLGDEIPGAVFTLTTDATAGSTTFTPPATLSFCDLGTTVVTAEAGAGGPSASLEIAITEGRPVVLDLVLSDNSVTASTTVTYTTATQDSCGNATSDFVDVFTNAPGAVIAAGDITGLTRAGTWTVVAQVPGTSVADTETLLVDADVSSTAVVLQLTTLSGFVDVPIGYEVTAVDGFGNPVDQATLVITTTDTTAAIDTTVRTITFGSAGVHTVTATLFGGTADVASDSAVVLITDPDLSAPDITIISPIAGVVVAPGGDVTVVARANDDRGLSQIFCQVSGSGAFDLQQQLVPLDPGTGLPELGPYDATFFLDVGGTVFGDVLLVCQAVDNAGNLVSSVGVTIRVDPVINLTLGAGLTASTVAWRDELRDPRGIAVDLTGIIYVTNNDDAFPLVVEIDPALAPPNNQAAFVIPQTGRNGEDIVFYDDPDVGDPDLFFVSYTGAADRIARVVASTGVFQLGWSEDNGNSPRGLVVEKGILQSQSRIAALYDDAIVRRFDPTNAAVNRPTLTTMNVTGPMGDGWGLEQLEPGCRAGFFQCADGTCLDRGQVCDGGDDCNDGTVGGRDEAATTCTAGLLFECANGVGIAESNICDGQNDCVGDLTLFGRDEDNCLRYAATDNGNNHEAWSFYDNGNGNGVAFSGRIGSQLDDPRGIAVRPDGRYAYVASRGGNSIFQIDLTESPVCDNNCPVVVSGFDEAWGLAFDATGLLVTDHADHAVYRIVGLP